MYTRAHQSIAISPMEFFFFFFALTVVFHRNLGCCCFLVFHIMYHQSAIDLLFSTIVFSLVFFFFWMYNVFHGTWFFWLLLFRLLCCCCCFPLVALAGPCDCRSVCYVVKTRTRRWIVAETNALGIRRLHQRFVAVHYLQWRSFSFFFFFVFCLGDAVGAKGEKATGANGGNTQPLNACISLDRLQRENKFNITTVHMTLPSVSGICLRV